MYNRSIFEIQVYHKKGLRYVPPEDLALFIFKKLNGASKAKSPEKAGEQHSVNYLETRGFYSRKLY